MKYLNIVLTVNECCQIVGETWKPRCWRKLPVYCSMLAELIIPQVGWYQRITPGEITTQNRITDVVAQVKTHLRTPLFANAYFLMGRTAVNAVSGFLFWWLAALFYEKTEVGLTAAIIAAAGLITSFSTLGLGFGIIRFLPSAAENSARLINYSFTLSGSVGMLLALVFIVGVGLWSPALLVLQNQMPFLVSFALLVTASSIIPLLDRTFMAKRSARYAFVMTAIVAVLKVAFLVSFFFAASSFAIVGAIALATVLTVIVSLFILLPKSHGISYRPSFVARMAGGSEMLRYSIGSYGADLLASVPGLVLPLIVINVLGEAANADFYIAWMIAGLIVAIPFAVRPHCLLKDPTTILFST